MAERWRNRIVEVRQMRIGDVLPHPHNPRTHPAAQMDPLRGHLNETGKTRIPTAYYSERNGGQLTFTDGHGRQALDPDEVWMIGITDLTDAEADLDLAVGDPLSALAGSDPARLDALLREVSTGEAAVQELLAALAEEHGIAPTVLPGAGGDDFDPTPDDGPTRCQPGDLWVIGSVHRLICGDSTDPAVVARLMGDDKAEMVWTDPPYGVAIGEKNQYLNSIAPSNRVEENLENDTLDEPALMAMLRAAFANAEAHCLAGGAWYVAAPPGPLHVLFGSALKERGIWRQTIQWVKNNATFAPLGVDYHWRAEPIFYGWKPGAGHRYYGGRKQDTVWEVDRPAASPDHPTMKPIELVQRAVENSSQASEIVLDVFGGSGTTLVAAHRAQRHARLVELSPRYCDVILRRAEAEGLAVERADV